MFTFKHTMNMEHWYVTLSRVYNLEFYLMPSKMKNVSIKMYWRLT